MPVVEKNDVDISKLFIWGGKLTVYDRLDKPVVDAWVRLVGDAEINRARVMAIRLSSEFRKKLREVGSDERLAYIPDASLTNKEDLIKALVILQMRELTQRALKETNLPIPVEPRSDASLEELEKFQEKVDKYETLRQAEITKMVIRYSNEYEKQYRAMSFEDLLKEYENLLIVELCEDRMVKAFREYCVYMGSFQDENYTKPLFKSFQEFENLPSEVKEQFLGFYASLEINTDDLKKLLEATP